MFNKLLSLPQKARNFLVETRNLKLIRASGLFDATWYLSNNPDVAEAKVDPLLHYLRAGGFEGRDPGYKFDSAYYLNAYPDVKNARVNPLVHYLRFGKAEGRQAQPHEYKYRCPVCLRGVIDFSHLDSSIEDNRRKYGYPFTFDDQETINPNQYSCPSCGASDRDRLYALYIGKAFEQNSLDKSLALLDIAPSHPLKMFLLKFPNIKYQSADKYMEDVDLVIDITNMGEITSEFYDMFICSHVLEHVTDDKKALSELSRILKPGGFGILMVPIVLKIEQIDEDPTIMDVETRWRRFGQYDHVRLYSKKGFIERVQEAGFIVNQYGVEYFGADEFTECGISTKSILYIVQKHAD